MEAFRLYIMRKPDRKYYAVIVCVQHPVALEFGPFETRAEAEIAGVDEMKSVQETFEKKFGLELKMQIDELPASEAN